jgi:hypothetical protein
VCQRAPEAETRVCARGRRKQKHVCVPEGAGNRNTCVCQRAPKAETRKRRVLSQSPPTKLMWFSTYRAFIWAVTQLRNSYFPYNQPSSENIQLYGVSQASTYTSVWFQKVGAKSHTPRISMDFPRVTPHPRETYFSIRRYFLASMISELDNMYQANDSYFPDTPSNE